MAGAVVLVTAAPEMARYLSFLLTHGAGGPREVVVAANELEGYLRTAEKRAELVVIDELEPLFPRQELVDLLHECLETRQAKILLLTGEDPEGAAAPSHLRRSDRVLAKPFRQEAFQEAVWPTPPWKRLGRAAWGWLSDQARLRLDPERYSAGQLAFAGALLALLVASAALQAHPASAAGAALPLLGPRAIFWGAAMLLVSLLAHVRSATLRWEALLFAKFAVLASITPPTAIHTVQRAILA